MTLAAQGGGQALPDQFHRRRALVFERFAEVALQGIAEEQEVLSGNGLIEPPVLLEALEIRLCRLDRQHHIERIAAHAGEAEHDHAHDQDGNETLEHPHRDEALHASP